MRSTGEGKACRYGEQHVQMSDSQEGLRRPVWRAHQEGLWVEEG